MAGKPARGIAGHGVERGLVMIGLSVAIGRFVEALFWAIFRVAGSVAALVIGGVIALLILALVARRVLRRHGKG